MVEGVEGRQCRWKVHIIIWSRRYGQRQNHRAGAWVGKAGANGEGCWVLHHSEVTAKQLAPDVISGGKLRLISGACAS